MKDTFSKAALAFTLAGAGMAMAQGPEVTGWYTVNASEFAEVVEVTGGTPITTWPTLGRPNNGGGVSSPTLSDIQQIRYSSNWVYVNASGLASYTMGPWYLDLADTQIFGNWPADKNVLARIPRSPTPATGTHTAVGLGTVGLMVNGVALFNNLDSFSYKNSSAQDLPGMGGDGYWHRLAIEEAPSFDPANAHQPTDGTYHYHTNPYGLRYQLGDNINFDGNAYTEDTVGPTHSPILGFAFDGYPVYGPYGYGTANDSGSGVRRMVSGYTVRNGSNGTTNLTSTGRHTIPQWSSTTYGHSVTLTPGQYGPNVNGAFPLGRYAEDYAYLGDLGFTQGTIFDLDQYNGRTCVTPEYPGGTYAYFVAMNADGSPAYPYMLGGQYYGVKSGGSVGSVGESTTTFFPVPSAVEDWFIVD
ncbi:YHYH protein [Candidatus Sumerlaeota bacterium]|nr:YHYH protein [Candidatus Sumerlaeota bacterium]